MRTLPALLLLSCSDRNPPADTADAADTTRRCLLVEEATTESDGVLGRHDVHVYDAKGRRLMTDYDVAGADGVVDSRRTYTYDASDRLVLTETDHDTDGTIDDVTVYAYDDAGRLVLESTTYGNDGTWEIRFTYDEAGRLATAAESAHDGEFEGLMTYVYDAPGRLVRADHESDDDGTPELVTDYLYAASGECEGTVTTSPDEGTVDNSFTYVTDPSGDVEVFASNPPASSWVETYDFDERGHVAAWVAEIDGSVTVRVDYTWDCPVKPDSDCVTWPTCARDGLAFPLLPRCGT